MADHKDEILTDNTQFTYCIRCISCRNWGNTNNPWTNKPDKSCCDKFMYPSFKPIGVINNQEDCPEFEPREK